MPWLRQAAHKRCRGLVDRFDGFRYQCIATTDIRGDLALGHVGILLWCECWATAGHDTSRPVTHHATSGNTLECGAFHAGRFAAHRRKLSMGHDRLTCCDSAVM